MKKACSDCGKPIHNLDHDKCRRCSTEIWGTRCPRCGGEKLNQAKLCSSCYHSGGHHYTSLGWRVPDDLPDFDSISSEWWYQFTGFFFGEGTATLHRTNKQTINARLSLMQRSDNQLAVQDIYEKLGGSFRVENRNNSNPEARWYLSQIHSVQKICEKMRLHTLIPCTKLNDIEIVLEFCNWRLSQPYAGVDFSPAEDMLLKLRAIRIFKDQG